jgi:hypothetical protein
MEACADCQLAAAAAVGCSQRDLFHKHMQGDVILFFGRLCLLIPEFGKWAVVGAVCSRTGKGSTHVGHMCDIHHSVVVHTPSN